jgi:RNA polymerase sigma factor (sigma-70 family)
MTSANLVIEALISEYYKLVFHIIYSLTGNWEESQDLTQDTFQQALKGIDAARSASGEQFHAKAWLLRIALNTVRMQRRRRALFRFIPFSAFQEKRALDESEGQDILYVQESPLPLQPGGYATNSAGDPADVIAEKDMVRRTLAKIQEPLRKCLLLSIIAGLSTVEIAELLGLKEDAVRQRLSRARRQFRQFYAYESQESLVPSSSYDRSEIHRSGGLQSATSKSTRLLLSIDPPLTGSVYV